jgi:hypothetical protein
MALCSLPRLPNCCERGALGGMRNSAEPPMNAREYQENYLGSRCPPMDEVNGRKK